MLWSNSVTGLKLSLVKTYQSIVAPLKCKLLHFELLVLKMLRVLSDIHGPFECMPLHVRSKHPDWLTLDCNDMTIIANIIYTFPQSDRDKPRVFMRLASTYDDTFNPALTAVLFQNKGVTLLYVPITDIRDYEEIILHPDLKWFRSDDNPTVLFYKP